jgi:hypothetical protein
MQKLFVEQCPLFCSERQGDRERRGAFRLWWGNWKGRERERKVRRLACTWDNNIKIVDVK